MNVNELSINVTVDNSVCSVQGLSNDEFNDVRNLLSYTETVRGGFARYRSVKRYMIDKRGFFPTGLLYLLEQHFTEKSLTYRLIDKRKRPTLNSRGLETLFARPLGIDPYIEQHEAAQACFEFGRGIIVAPTGVGKSLMAVLICEALKVSTLIVTPSLALKQQMTEGLTKFFGPSLVGPLSSSGQPQRLISVENVDALDPKRPMKNIDCVILDEFHHSGAATYRTLNKFAWGGVYYKFGLTATPFRSRDEERLLLESVLSQVIYRIPYEVAVSKGYIVPMEVYYYDLPKLDLKCNEKSYPAVYSELIVHREDRNRLIAQLAANLEAEARSTLVLTKQIDHGTTLQDHLLEYGYDVAFAEGKNDNNTDLIDEFNLRERNSLMGTMGVIGEGVDTKPCEYVVLAGGGKSRNQFMQNAGRGFRKYPGKDSCKLIMFRDSSHKWMVEHFKACCKTLKEEYGITPVKLELPEGF